MRDLNFRPPRRERRPTSPSCTDSCRDVPIYLVVRLSQYRLVSGRVSKYQTVWLPRWVPRCCLPTDRPGVRCDDCASGSRCDIRTATLAPLDFVRSISRRLQAVEHVGGRLPFEPRDRPDGVAVCVEPWVGQLGAELVVDVDVKLPVAGRQSACAPEMFDGHEDTDLDAEHASVGHVQPGKTSTIWHCTIVASKLPADRAGFCVSRGTATSRGTHSIAPAP